MSEGKKESKSSSSEDVEAIKLYESMSADEIDAELKKAGINPQPTIDAVKDLVRERQGRDRQ